jgi:hypothetical protein
MSIAYGFYTLAFDLISDVLDHVSFWLRSISNDCCRECME